MADRNDEIIRATSELLDVLQEELGGALPSSRCISLSSLKPIIKAAQSRLSSPVFRKFSAVKIVGILKDAGLLTPIPLLGGQSQKPPVVFAVGFNLPALPSAFEVLQAFKPKGVLCYFSALELHGLTTQPAPHYHVATYRADSEASEPGHQQGDVQHSLGTEAFIYEGVVCYQTARERRNLRAVQRRQLNSQSIVQITSLEQTLLDCLHRPASAGGAAVIFEAWETAISKIQSDRMWRLLEEIADIKLFRRAGYMLDIHDGDPILLQKIRDEADLNALHIPPDTLLPGIPYTQTNSSWQLLTA